MNLNLFDNNFTIVKCILKNKYEIKIMIDNDSNNYEFIDFVIAYEICEILKCVFVKLIKYRMTKDYDEKTNFFIIYVIYFRMKIDLHIENLVALIITLLINHSMILKRFWMIKHEIIIDVTIKQYDEKIVKWRKNHCDHLKAFDHSFSIMSITNLSNDIKKNFSAMISTKILKRNSDSRFWKKNLNKIETFIIFVFQKKQTTKN